MSGGTHKRCTALDARRNSAAATSSAVHDAGEPRSCGDVCLLYAYRPADRPTYRDTGVVIVSTKRSGRRACSIRAHVLPERSRSI